MKKLISILFAFALGIAVIAPTVPAQAQQYCGACCDRDPYGNARVRCVLSSPGLCGYACYCNGIPGTGFAC